MMYQMADNNLEFYIRQDFEELTNAPVMKSPDLRTWVYFDARNSGGGPLPNTVDANDMPITAPFTGSRYVTYNATLGKMKIDTQFEIEWDSDLGTTMEAFLNRALPDCLSNGYTSLMLVFSSHGGGFAGFGGDENAGRRNRKLLQENAVIAQSIRSALDTAGATKLDVIGFDACLMSSVEAADDYLDVANYLLASEAVEPGHGM